MSENSCTTHDARLDSVCDDAPKALRGLAERNFHREKKCEYISPEGCFDAHPECASDRKRPESVPADSQNRLRGSVWQALDEAQRRSSSRRFSPTEGRPSAAADAAARRDRCVKRERSRGAET